MAWIGLRTPGSTTGTSVASDMVKALLGDPTDVMNAAKTRSYLESQDIARQVDLERKALLTQQTLDQAQKNQQSHDSWVKLYDARDAATQRIHDSLQQPAPPAIEEPVPVVLESGGGGGVPEHLRNFDERHQPIVAAPPLRLPAGTPLDAYEPPVEVGELTDSYVARARRTGDLTETGRRGILGEVGFPMPALPPQLAGVPPELAQAPPPAGPVVGGAPDNPLVGGGKPLIDLRALLGGGEEEPVPALPEGYATPPAVLDEIPPRPASVTPEPVPTPYLPDPTPGMVPMEDLPLPVEEPAPEQALRQPAGTPFPATVDPAPTTAIEPPLPVGEEATPAPVAEQAAASAAPPAATPSQAPVTAPDKTRITIKGTGGGQNDTPAAVDTKFGSVSRERIQAEVDAIMFSEATPAQKQQALQMLQGTLGVTYDESVGPKGDLGRTSAAYTLATGTALPMSSAVTGDEQIRVANATGDIKTTMIDDRAYTLAKTPDGRTVATLVEGQPAAAGENPFGDSAEGNMRNSMSKMLVAQPDPKTWSPQQKQDYAIMADALYGAKVTVSENGKITVVSGNLPKGVLPGDAGFSPTAPPPPTTGTETPPPETQAQPATGQPTTTTPAPAPAAGEGGRPIERINGIEVKNYGGWLRTGEQPKQTTSNTPAGEVLQIESTGPTDMDEQVGKEFGYTKNVLTPGKYLLDLTSDKVPNRAAQVVEAVTANNSLTQTLSSAWITPEEREYFQNVRRFINAVTHKASGADVTAADLRTYSYLFSLPPKENVAASDLRILKNAVIEDIKNSRTGWNGRVPAGQLREFDLDIARKGYDLDKVYTDADAGMSEDPDIIREE